MGTKINLIGQRFNRLTVIEDSGLREKNGGVIWTCLCDCGNYINAPAHGLKNGDYQSCGCLNKELYSIRGKKNIKDLAGQKFGKLTVIEQTDKREVGSVVWICQCDCRNKKEVSARNLIHHKVSSCGCGIRSLGEQEIESLLQKNYIKYKTEVSFSDLLGPSNSKPLRFDFGIYNEKNELCYLIEFDGKQHFEESFFVEIDSLEDRQKRDKMKDDYCKENNIPLIRIPYTKLGKIDIQDIKL